MRLTLSGYNSQLTDLINVDLLKYNQNLDSNNPGIELEVQKKVKKLVAYSNRPLKNLEIKSVKVKQAQTIKKAFSAKTQMQKMSKELQSDITEALEFRDKMEDIKIKFKDLFLNINEGSNKNSLGEINGPVGSNFTDSNTDIRKLRALQRLGSPSTLKGDDSDSGSSQGFSQKYESCKSIDCLFNFEEDKMRETLGSQKMLKLQISKDVLLKRKLK